MMLVFKIIMALLLAWLLFMVYILIRMTIMHNQIMYWIEVVGEYCKSRTIPQDMLKSMQYFDDIKSLDNALWDDIFEFRKRKLLKEETYLVLKEYLESRD